MTEANISTITTGGYAVRSWSANGGRFVEVHCFPSERSRANWIAECEVDEFRYRDKWESSFAIRYEMEKGRVIYHR